MAQVFSIMDFSGGLNERDSMMELAPNETPAMRNWRLDQRGMLSWRQGHVLAVALPGTSGKVPFLHHSKGSGLWFCARESGGVMKLFTRPSDLSGVWTDRGTINSDVTTKVAFADFPGNPPKVVITTDKNGGATKGTWSYDSTGGLVLLSANVAGSAAELWQNSVWVCGYPTADANGHPSRLIFCTAGDLTQWGNFIDVRDLNADPLIGLAVVNGALVSFKEFSSYRHHDPVGGFYNTIEPAAGLGGPYGLAMFDGRAYTWASNGLFRCDGNGPLVNVGDKIQPRYSVQGAKIVGAGRLGRRLLFGWSEDGAVIEGLIEYSPDDGWLLMHRSTNIALHGRTFVEKDAELYAAGGDNLYKLLAGGTAGSDEGTRQDADWLTPWFQPGSGMLSRLHRLRVQGLLANGGTTTLKLRVMKDWDTNVFTDYQIEGQLRGDTGSTALEFADLQSLGHSEAFAFQFFTGAAAGGAVIGGLHMIDESIAYGNPGYPGFPDRKGKIKPKVRNLPEPSHRTGRGPGGHSTQRGPGPPVS